MTQLVLLETTDSVAILTLNRPERHNSLIPSLLEEMLVTLNAIQAKPGVRAVVLQANGRSFSTGGDMRGFFEQLEALEDYAERLVGLLNQVILALVSLPVPIIAAVHGVVTGGSMGLVLGSDIVLVAPEASFTPYYSVVGFSPDGGWTALLPAIIGPKRVARILALNGTISAEEAVGWGLADCQVPAQQIREEALSRARQIASARAGSLRHAKRLLGLALGGVEARLDTERREFIRQIATQEAREGIVAFLGNKTSHARAGG
jgi:2-(1,2-epoxy-1,2-dihydrophenyl)acetyl-CoA isomerase